LVLPLSRLECHHLIQYKKLSYYKLPAFVFSLPLDVPNHTYVCVHK
jgi:hypothetical protein